MELDIAELLMILGFIQLTNGAALIAPLDEMIVTMMMTMIKTQVVETAGWKTLPLHADDRR